MVREMMIMTIFDHLWARWRERARKRESKLHLLKFDTPGWGVMTESVASIWCWGIVLQRLTGQARFTFISFSRDAAPVSCRLALAAVEGEDGVEDSSKGLMDEVPSSRRCQDAQGFTLPSLLQCYKFNFLELLLNFSPVIRIINFDRGFQNHSFHFGLEHPNIL